LSDVLTVSTVYVLHSAHATRSYLYKSVNFQT